MKKSFKLLSVILILLLAVSALSACGSRSVQQSGKDAGGSQTGDTGLSPARQTVEFSVEGETTTEEYAVFDSSILSIAYDDKTLSVDMPDTDDSEIVKFESGGMTDIDIELTAQNTGDYKTAAEYARTAESKDNDVIQLSGLEDVAVNGYSGCYFSVSENDSFHEYYFIEYSGSNADIKYVVFEAEFNPEAVEGWVPRTGAMVNTINFK